MNNAIAILVLLTGASAVTFFRVRSQNRARALQARRDAQAERMRKAEKRMADNGGRPLSARLESKHD